MSEVVFHFTGEVFDYRLFNLFGVFIGFEEVGSAIYEVGGRDEDLDSTSPETHHI